MSYKQNITFTRLTRDHLPFVDQWLQEQHILDHWDTTPEHRKDIQNFVEGRKTPSTYCEGQYVYWVVMIDGRPYGMIMTIQETPKSPIDIIKLQNLSKAGHSYGLDFMIGEPKFLGKGLAAPTLDNFLTYFRRHEDPKADTFLIDPELAKPRAIHVYVKAGFKEVGEFTMSGSVSGSGKPHMLLVRRFMPQISLRKITFGDKDVLQNMARFYVYDLSKDCGHLSLEWDLPEDGMYKSFDFSHYITDEDREAFFIVLEEKIVGFILLNKAVFYQESNWNVGEFFVLGKYQGMGIGRLAMSEIFKRFPGQWEMTVIPENKSALLFWESIAIDNNIETYKKEKVTVSFDKDQPQRILFVFAA